MKITDVTLTLFAWEGIPARQFGGHTGRIEGTSDLGLLTIATDEGIEGHAFLGSSSRAASYDGGSLVKFLKPLVVGQDPLHHQQHYKAMMRRARHTTLRCIGAVDVALWDIAGQTAGLPLYKLLGASREKIAAYASSQVMGNPAAYAEEAAALKAKGMRGYKIHPPTRWREDIAACRATREAVGPDHTLMLDSTWSYDYPTALRVGRAIEELGYYWYEDPLGEEDLYNYVKLKRRLDIPILATEYSPGGFQSYAPWVVNQATDFLRGDVAVKGGVTGVLKGAHLAEAFHMNFEVHHGGNSLNNVANLHLILSIPNTEFFEILLPDATQKYGLQQDIEVDPEGYVTVPEGPGLGAAIDFDLIRSKQTAVLS